MAGGSPSSGRSKARAIHVNGQVIREAAQEPLFLPAVRGLEESGGVPGHPGKSIGKARA